MGIKSYLKLGGKERSQKKDLKSHLRIKLGTSRTEGLVLSKKGSLLESGVLFFFFEAFFFF